MNSTFYRGLYSKSLGVHFAINWWHALRSNCTWILLFVIKIKQLQMSLYMKQEYVDFSVAKQFLLQFKY